MNMVSALKSLYKALVGVDWPYDPNPTDAEVVSKIAEDYGSNETSNDDE